MTTPRPASGDTVLEQAITWFVRLDDGSLNTAEQAEFEAWRQAPAHAAAMARVERMWADLGTVPTARRSRPAVPLAHRRPRRAAAMALAASVLLGLSMMLDLPARLQADLRTGPGETTTDTLPDGSSVSLGSGSAISVSFSAERRVVRLLRGEALFTVAPDPARPFVVEAGEGQARALGTRFAVRRHDGGKVAVTVLESHVRVSCCAEAETAVTLAPGQQAEYAPAGGVSNAREVDAEAETAWTRGKLIFTGRPLGQVIEELNRYFPGHITLNGESLRGRLVSGVFSTTDPLAAIDGLEQSLDLRTTRLGPWLIVVHE